MPLFLLLFLAFSIIMVTLFLPNQPALNAIDIAGEGKLEDTPLITQANKLGANVLFAKEALKEIFNNSPSATDSIPPKEDIVVPKIEPVLPQNPVVEPQPPTPVQEPTPPAPPAEEPDPITDIEPSINPFKDSEFYVDPYSDAKKWADANLQKRSADAKLMAKIANQPVAKWFGDWNTDIRKDVDEATSIITKTGALPVFVAYNIPHRDCGRYSAGGAAKATTYKNWIDDFALGIGFRKAVIILEPDALPAMECLSKTDQEERMNLIKYAVSSFKKQGNIFTYIDAGNSNWINETVMAERLKQSGIEDAEGFALNVSNFHTTENNISYGEKLSGLLNKKHFVIDTSRNGNGPASNNEWCNPKDRALGDKPTTETDNPLVDLFFWIKIPGQSDGECQGGPKAGTFWPEYALELARNASW